MNHFLYQLRRVKIKELIQIWKLPVGAIAGMIYRIKHKDLWIISEDKYEARDNGYWFFKFLRENHPEQECIYAISGNSPDIEKICAIGSWVEYGSLRHWIFYFASRKKISSQKAGNPNAAIFYFLEVYGLLKDKRIFLQHGVIKDDLKWLYYDVTKFDRFICGAYPEYEYICSLYGYPKGQVCYTGLCRFDAWQNANHTRDRMILIMPTWREWIADEDYRLEEYEGTTIISNTEYFRNWKAFLDDSQLKEIAQKYKVHFVFYPHRNMQKYIDCFPDSSSYLTIASAKDIDIQKLLISASMMVTDYSSVFFDMIYMKKPLVFYQFDYDKFRKGQYEEGYFDYSKNPFGYSFRSKVEVYEEIIRIIESDFRISNEYMNAHKEFFPLYDNNNCERIYDVVKKC